MLVVLAEQFLLGFLLYRNQLIASAAHHINRLAQILSKSAFSPHVLQLLGDISHLLWTCNVMISPWSYSKGVSKCQTSCSPPSTMPLSFIDVRPCCFCCIASRRTPRVLLPQQQSLVIASEFMFSGPYTWQKGSSSQPTHLCLKNSKKVETLSSTKITYTN